MDKAEIIEKLSNGDVITETPSPLGITRPIFATLTSGINAVIKPDWHYVGNEVGAFKVSEYLGWDLVPPTINRRLKLSLRNNRERKASLQYFIKDAKMAYAPQEMLNQVIVFDYLIGNDDRHGGNGLITPDNKFWAIDHNYAFTSHYDDRYYLGAVKDKGAFDKLGLSEWKDLIEFKNVFSSCEKDLLSVLSPSKVDRMHNRLIAILKYRRLK